MFWSDPDCATALWADTFPAGSEMQSATPQSTTTDIVVNLRRFIHAPFVGHRSGWIQQAAHSRISLVLLSKIGPSNVNKNSLCRRYAKHRALPGYRRSDDWLG